MLQDLFSMWEQQGPQVASGMAPVTADVLGPDTPSDMSPEQVQLVMHHFDQARATSMQHVSCCI